MLEKIHTRFNERIQLHISCAELLPQSLADAAQRIVACLLHDHKVVIAGVGRSYPNAQLLYSHLLHRYELSRPSFASVLLHYDSVLAGSIESEEERQQIYAKQLSAQLAEKDVLVVFLPTGDEQAVRNTLQIANSENLDIIAFTGQNIEKTEGLLDESDVIIRVPSDNEIRVIETHQFCLNLLCELVDHLLFYANHE